jgi:acyl-CoA synthetase (AMP-forming)/AMP-acid ligase II
VLLYYIADDLAAIRNLINNATFTGDILSLTTDDVICCPPPLFHCFGLVMGFLCAFSHGCTIVYPCQQFDPSLVVKSIEAERCTILHGVPTMFGAELDELAKAGRKLTSVRMALAAGAPVPRPMAERLQQEMGIKNVAIAYGMTETSPVSFSTCPSDSPGLQLSTVGKVFPHTQAKIVDVDGAIVPCGVKGEICTSGYALQRGYLKNEEKTLEAMRVDASGTVWMHTGDEGTIDQQGYCRVTGRIKDLIIRGERCSKVHVHEKQQKLTIALPGGENIAPAEIEERLLSHGAIEEAAVVGATHPRLGEQVVAFLRQSERVPRPDDADLVKWVRQSLARHKSPEHVFWIGDEGVGVDFPKTASGKHQKHLLRDIAVALIQPAVRARL